MGFNKFQKKIPEFIELRSILANLRNSKRAQIKELTTVQVSGQTLPVHGIRLGAPGKNKPAVVLTGGVHGLERIGAQVVISYLHTLQYRLRWDHTLRLLLDQVTLYFIPIVNPGGLYRGTRANVNGVDLMRNAPVEAEGRVPFLGGGHRLGGWLPYYRGKKDTPMEPEAQALCDFVEDVLDKHDTVISLDCHSGFGSDSRVWFPYARKVEPFYHLGEIYALKNLFDHTYPHHFYKIEPQARNYTTHGDLWDYLFDRYLGRLSGKKNGRKLFLPLTLEMGSWLWVKKNPRQFFSFHGIFNPIKPHRQRRVLRQNLTFFEFLSRAAINSRRWLPRKKDKIEMERQATRLWYRKFYRTRFL